MRACLSSISFTIFINGSAKGWVKASRGLIQGDSLFPFLFTLVADILSILIFRAEGLIKGFLVGINRIRMSISPFSFLRPLWIIC